MAVKRMKIFERDRYLPLRRIITIDSTPGEIAARIADIVHQFGVTVRHDGVRVTAIGGTAERVPWTTCPGALARLDALVGVPLAGSAPTTIDKAQQCTHLFDLARLAMAHAAPLGRRRYDVDVALGALAGTIEATVHRDGIEQLRWTVAADRVIGEGPWEGHGTTGPVRWPDGMDDPDIRQAALLLRRALLVFIGSGGGGEKRYAAQMPYMTGACHTYQPAAMAVAERPPGFRQLPADQVEAAMGDRGLRG
jgi:hypothetical protein